MSTNDLLDFYRRLDRSIFLDGTVKTLSSLDRPLPIGFGQTISQPSLVLDMTRMLKLEKGFKVLEIGTGSGYQTAFLAEFSGEVYTVERIPELSEKARKTHDKLGYTNIHYLICDGSLGWKENAPYDRIIVTAAAGSMPRELAEQLRAGGKMLLPLGPQGMQTLSIVTIEPNGSFQTESLYAVTFVEFKGKYGWQEPTEHDGQ